MVGIRIVRQSYESREIKHVGPADAFKKSKNFRFHKIFFESRLCLTP